MLLTEYDNLGEFVKDLITASVLDKESAPQFLEELKTEKVKIIFFDNEPGEFTCYVWFREGDPSTEEEVISSIADAWAYYCNVSDQRLLTYLKTGCLLTNAVFKGLGG